jgi:hypothetical protein
MVENKYQRGKIYKIVNDSLNLTYYGSTIEPTVARRLTHHKTNYKEWKNGRPNYTTCFKLMEEGNFQIILLENYPCNSKDELHARERYYIENNDCVNKIMPTRTRQEYYKFNKDILNEKSKEYYESNKEEVKQKAKLHYDINKDKISEQKKIYYNTHKDKLSEQKKKYYDTNKAKINEQKKAYYIANKNKILESKKANYDAKKDKKSEI